MAKKIKKYSVKQLDELVDKIDFLKNLGRKDIELKLWIILKTNTNTLNPINLVNEPCRALMEIGYTYQDIMAALVKFYDEEIIVGQIIGTEQENRKIHNYGLSGNSKIEFSKFIYELENHPYPKNEQEMIKELLLCGYDQNQELDGYIKNFFSHNTSQRFKSFFINLNSQNAIGFTTFIGRRIFDWAISPDNIPPPTN